MSYILIFIYIGGYASSSAVAEFNTASACEAAAKEIRKQLNAPSSIALCAAKGVK